MSHSFSYLIFPDDYPPAYDVGVIVRDLMLDKFPPLQVEESRFDKPEAIWIVSSEDYDDLEILFGLCTTDLWQRPNGDECHVVKLRHDRDNPIQEWIAAELIAAIYYGVLDQYGSCFFEGLTYSLPHFPHQGFKSFRQFLIWRYGKNTSESWTQINGALAFGKTKYPRLSHWFKVPETVPVTKRWRPYNNGVEIGEAGSEGGTITVDLELTYADGEGAARITVEEVDPNKSAATIGVYGLMAHTVFATQIEADRVEELKRKVELIVIGLESQREVGQLVEALAHE